MSTLLRRLMDEHRVRAVPVLPGAAILEMARAAASRASGAPVSALEAVTFLRPARAGAALSLDVVTETRTFVLRDAVGELARGRFVLGEPAAPAESPPTAPLGASSSVEPRALYAWFAQMGLGYGPAFQVITALRRTETQVWADLNPPADLDARGVELHPSILDGALHALGSLAYGQEAGALYLPFAIDRLQLHAPCTEEARVVAKLRHRGADSARADVWITSPSGEPWVTIEGVSLKSVRLGAAATAPTFVPAWRASPPVARAPSDAARWWVVGDAPAGFGAGLHAERVSVSEARARLAVEAPQGLALFATSGSAALDEPSLIARLERDVVEVIALLGAVAERRDTPPRVVMFADEAAPENEALLGVSRVLRLELPSTRAHAVRYSGATVAALEAELSADEPEVRLADGARWLPDEAPLPARTADGPRTGAVALITGGLGGLGLATARALFERHGARVALIGRRGAPAGSAAAAEVARLRAQGATVLVLEADTADRASLGAAVARIREALGPVELVVHAAGVTHDALLRTKSRASVWSVLRPKVLGVQHLDALLADDPVAHTVLYASVVGLAGNYGQADYAAANRYLDAWARLRSRPGRRVVSVDWGPWAEVGMAKDITEGVRRSGLVPLTAAGALAALDAILHTDAVQAAVVERAASLGASTTTARVAHERATNGAASAATHSAGNGAPARVAHERATNGATNGANGLHAAPVLGANGAQDEPKVRSASAHAASPLATGGATTARSAATSVAALEALLLDELARVLEVGRGELDPETSFRDYGLDSILGAQLIKELERRLAVTVPPSVFFESSDARALAGRLATLVAAANAGTHAAPADAPPTDAAPAEPAPATTDAHHRDTDAGARATPVAARASPVDADAHEPIAVIGYALRVPGAVDAEALHALLSAGQAVFTEVPPERWPLDAYYDVDPEAPGKTYARMGAFLGAVDRFDPLAYGISPREAARMDPTQRLLLDLAREAMEHTGLGPRLHGTDTGVFVGGAASEYGQRFLAMPERIDGHTGTGSSSSLLAGRVSHTFDLRGPSFTVDTACSSGLVALHLAMEALRRGECSTALVGAVNLLLGPETFVAFSKGRLLSPTGRPRPFAPDADGYVRAEAGVTLALAPLSRARALGCTVYGLLRGSAVAQDGRTRGLTLPDVEGEARALGGALRRAGLTPAELHYVEAHAVGSLLGDRAELEAVAQVMSGSPCEIGSHKALLGHSEVASGLVSIAKLLASFERGELPATRGASLPADAEAAGLRLQGAARAIAPGFRAAVNAFGFGGTTAAVILEAPPDLGAAPAPKDTALLLTLSARQPDALAALAAQHLAALPRTTRPADYCHTANTGRTHERLRLAVAAPDRDALVNALAERVRAGLPSSPSESRPRVALLFTGQGAQYAGMGRELYRESATFRGALDRCSTILRGHLPVPLLDAMFDGTSLDDTALTQPALFAFEWATTALWRAAGLEITALLGHSVGELVAAAVSGALSLEDALALTAARGRLISALPRGGAMLAVSAAEAAVADLVDEVEVSLAAVNSPSAVVLSGLVAAIERTEAALAQRGVRSKRLTVSHAFHSPLMDPMLASLGEVAARLEHRAPTISVVSNVDGRIRASFDAAHWVRHVRAPVRFQDGVRALVESGAQVLLEVGPTATLTSLARATVGAAHPLDTLRSFERGRPPRETLQAAAGVLFTRGADLDLALLETEPRARIAVPRSAHSPRRLWIERAPAEAARPPVEAAPTPATAAPTPATAAPTGGGAPLDAEVFLIAELARALELLPSEVDPTRPVGELGLDSVVALEVAARVGAAFGVEPDVELLSLERSVREIAAALPVRGAAPCAEQPREAAATAAAATLPAVDPADYAQFGRPALLARLSAASLDKCFVEGRGDRVWFEENGQRVEVLDMLGGFGSTLFGHNNPDLVATAKAILDRGVVHHAQGSTRTAAGTLGRKLSERLQSITGRPFVSTFLNTGAEAIEAAIKHSQLEYTARAEAHARARHKRDACLLHDLGAELTLPYALREQLAAHLGEPAPERLSDAIVRLCEAEASVFEERPAFVALERSFHGKTAATSLLTANPGYRSRYTEGIRVLRSGTIEDLGRQLLGEERALVWLTHEGGTLQLARAPWACVAAAFVEPVQGEGGVRPLSPELLAEIRRQADHYGFPVVADEVQAGFGRCGAFSASAALGLFADYYAFGKSLGGGLSKISVLCVSAERHQADFDLFHTSTFAEDDPSALLGLRALEIYDRDGLEARAREAGARLMTALEAVRRRHPSVLKEVRGMGLLVGIELCDMSSSSSPFIRLTEENLGNLAAAWFLHVERIRFLPTSSATQTLRLEPSAYVSDADLDRVVAAFERFAVVLERGNVAHLLAPLVGEVAPAVVRDWSIDRPFERITAGATERRVAFVTYFVEPDDMVRWAPAMAELSSGARDALLERLHPVIAPRVFRSARIESNTGDRVFFEVYGLMATSEIIERAMRAGDLDWIRQRIDEAVELAIDSGAQVVGFGGLTSIVTRNCRKAATDRAALTTGNALTVAMGIEGLRRAATKSGVELTRARMGVVGATGNIGETYARVMAESCERFMLVGRPGARARLEAVADRLYEDAAAAALAGSEVGLARVVRGTRAFAEGRRGAQLRQALARELTAPPVLVSERMEDLRGCPVVLTASNSARAIIHPEHVGAGPVVICDVAVPPDVSPEVLARPGVRVVTGGAARLPKNRELDLCVGHLPRGHVYACMAETILLGLEGRRPSDGHFSFGPIERERVREIWAIAQRHGFTLEEEPEPELAAPLVGTFDVARLN